MVQTRSNSGFGRGDTIRFNLNTGLMEFESPSTGEKMTDDVGVSLGKSAAISFMQTTARILGVSIKLVDEGEDFIHYEVI